MSTKNITLVRLLECLELAEVPKRARNKTVVEKTKYSPSMVAKYLAGNLPLNIRFITAVCSAFSINSNYVLNGEGPWYVLGTTGETERDANSDEIAELVELVESDIAFKEALKEVRFMSVPKRWEAVAMLKRMNAEETK